MKVEFTKGSNSFPENNRIYAKEDWQQALDRLNLENDNEIEAILKLLKITLYQIKRLKLSGSSVDEKSSLAKDYLNHILNSEFKKDIEKLSQEYK